MGLEWGPVEIPILEAGIRIPEGNRRVGTAEPGHSVSPNLPACKKKTRCLPILGGVRGRHMSRLSDVAEARMIGPRPFGTIET